MKKYLVFIIILLSSYGKIYSCVYYPFGEDLRYSLFLPEYFDYKDFKAFNYNSNLFGFNYEYKKQFESNAYDWYNYTNKKVPIDEIDECLNSLTLTDINASSPNQFVQYLYKNKLNSTIQYLITAKQCEAFNVFEEGNSWENNEKPKQNIANFLIKLKKITETEKSDFFKRKYAFLTIRTAFYGGNYNLIKSFFSQYFETSKKDYLYYWALFFNSFQNKNASIDIANIMAYSNEKKYASYYYFHEQFKIEDALSKAKSNSDIANAYAYASVQRLEPNLDYLEKIYENSRKSRILDFLLLREINKIEDWVYTPYYTNYLPSIEFSEYNWSDNSEELQTTEVLRNRSEKDRLYAKQVLDFINAVDYKKIQDVSLWKASQIQLLFITRNYKECLNKISAFEKKYSKETFYAQIEKIKALCIISNQEVGRAIVKEEAKPIILKYLDDRHFMFSIGRELEYRKNLPDGMAFIAYADTKVIYNYEGYYANSLVWQGNRLMNSGNLASFYGYFDYLDFVYSANDLQIIINKLDSKIEDNLSVEVYKQLNKDKNYLKDLLGTKYFRENRLLDAEKTFESVGQKYWDENYNSWERDRYDDYYAFDKNPFFDIKYTSSFVPHKDKFIVTKLSVTQYLLKYISLANNPKTEDRDYYYFIIGNCYLNMTQYGHSWMMRRFSSTSDFEKGNNESYIDDIEYRNGIIAQKYYQLAYENAKTEKFKALCLRMEDYAKDNIDSDYEKLKSTYPSYYDDLSNCDNLEAYFRSRR